MTLQSLGILRAKDMPAVDVVLVEEPQPRSPYGIKGVGEIGLVPTAGAVAAALHDLDGQWRTPPADAPRPATRADDGVTADHAGAGLRPPPPLLGAGPGHARRRRAPRRTFLEILEPIWWRLDVALDLDAIAGRPGSARSRRWSAARTAIVDHHESPDAIEGSLDVIADACAEVGVRVVVRYGVTDRHGADGAKAGLAENERFLRADPADGHRRAWSASTPAFTCSDDTLDARRPGWPPTSASACTSTSPRAAVDADAGGPARRRWPTTAGCSSTACTCDDHGLPGTIVHNPRSNMNNAVGYARPARFANPVALGTDGIGADMLEEFRLAFARLRERRRHRRADDGVGLAGRGLGTCSPRRSTTGSRWTYAPMDPWHLAYTTGVRPLRGRGRRRGRAADGRGPPASTPPRSGPRPPRHAAAAVRPMVTNSIEEPMTRLALYLQDAHPIREGMDFARYAEAARLRGGVAGREPAGARGHGADGRLRCRAPNASGSAPAWSTCWTRNPALLAVDLLHPRRPGPGPGHPRHRRLVGSAGGQGGHHPRPGR